LIFFLDLGKGSSRLPRIENKPDNKPIVSGIIVSCRSALVITRSLVASRQPWLAFQTHGRRCCETKDMVYLSGRGQREQMFLRRELITIVTPLHRPGSANTAASVCLYIGNKKDHCSQPQLGRHHMCQPPSMSADRLATGGSVVSHTRHPVGDHVTPSCFQCHGA